MSDLEQVRALIEKWRRLGELCGSDPTDQRAAILYALLADELEALLPLLASKYAETALEQEPVGPQSGNCDGGCSRFHYTPHTQTPWCRNWKPLPVQDEPAGVNQYLGEKP